MPDPTLADSYFGDTITINLLSTKVNLLKLMQAIAPNLNGTFTRLSIVADSTNTGPVLMGSDRITATNYAYAIAVGTPYVLSIGSHDPIPAARIWLWTAAAAILHVEAFL